MTVAELIKILQELPQGYPVRVVADYDYAISEETKDYLWVRDDIEEYTAVLLGLWWGEDDRIKSVSDWLAQKSNTDEQP